MIAIAQPWVANAAIDPSAQAEIEELESKIDQLKQRNDYAAGKAWILRRIAGYEADIAALGGTFSDEPDPGGSSGGGTSGSGNEAKIAELQAEIDALKQRNDYAAGKAWILRRIAGHEAEIAALGGTVSDEPDPGGSSGGDGGGTSGSGNEAEIAELQAKIDALKQKNDYAAGKAWILRRIAGYEDTIAALGGAADDSGDDNGSGSGGDGSGNGGDGSGNGDDTPDEPDPPTTLSGFPDLPQPLTNLKIYHLNPAGSQKVTGPGNQDLLIVAPDQPITGTFKLEVDGFRGVWWIGGTLNPAAMGTLVTPNGKTVDGVGTLVKIKTHKNPISRPFIVLARLHLKTDNIEFGDFLQLGGDTKAGDWGAWPDVYRCRIIAEELYGWSGYNGGSFSQYVSHSDFTKFETGGVRHSYAAKIRVDWGYQAEYVLPSHASDKKPYAGPDGYGTAHYWDYVVGAVTNPAIKSKDNPKVIFLARSSEEVQAKDHISYIFHDQGKGNYLIPAGGSDDILDHVHPGGGAFKPIDKGDYIVWPSASGRPFVTGKLNNGGRVNVPTVVTQSEVGYQHRVTNRSELLAALNTSCR